MFEKFMNTNKKKGESGSFSSKEEEKKFAEEQGEAIRAWADIDKNEKMSKADFAKSVGDSIRAWADIDKDEKMTKEEFAKSVGDSMRYWADIDKEEKAEKGSEVAEGLKEEKRPEDMTKEEYAKSVGDSMRYWAGMNDDEQEKEKGNVEATQKEDLKSNDQGERGGLNENLEGLYGEDELMSKESPLEMKDSSREKEVEVSSNGATAETKKRKHEDIQKEMWARNAKIIKETLSDEEKEEAEAGNQGSAKSSQGTAKGSDAFDRGAAGVFIPEDDDDDAEKKPKSSEKEPATNSSLDAWRQLLNEAEGNEKGAPVTGGVELPEPEESELLPPEVKPWRKGYEEASQTTSPTPTPTPEPGTPAPEQPRGPEAPRLPAEAPRIFARAYEAQQSRPGRVWGWLRARVKGLFTLGYNEIRHAEMFRTQTGTEATRIEARARDIQRTQDLSEEAAHEEALRMREIARREGRTELSREDYQRFSDYVTLDKTRENNRVIEGILQDSTNTLAEKLRDYRNQFDQSVITSEVMENFQVRLRDQLLRLQEGCRRIPTTEGGEVIDAPARDVETFKRTIRESLSKDYWSRYIYGPVELVLGGLALWKMFAVKGAAAVVEGGGGAGKIAAETFYTMEEGDTLWAIAKANLIQGGIANPTNLQIMNGSKILAVANNVGVNAWNIAGTPLDTMMAVGTKVKLAALIKNIPLIATMA